MQPNVSDSLADLREERLKRKVGRRDGRVNREYTFYIHHGLWLGWWVREFGLWLQQGDLSFSCEISSLPSFFCKGKALFFTIQLLILQVSIWQCATVLCPMLLIPWLRETKKSLLSQVRMSKSIKIKHMEPSAHDFYGDRVWPNQKRQSWINFNSAL